MGEDSKPQAQLAAFGQMTKPGPHHRVRAWISKIGGFAWLIGQQVGLSKRPKKATRAGIVARGGTCSAIIVPLEKAISAFGPP